MSKNVENEIRNALDKWLQAFNDNDLEGLTDLYDPEINYANSAKAIEIGIPAIKEGFANSFAIKPKVTFKEEQVIAEDRLGYIAGQFRVSGTNPEDGSTVGEAGRVVAIFRKNTNDQWKLVFDMDNRPPDVII
jgi:ketosteroid isomerase-like protein